MAAIRVECNRGSQSYYQLYDSKYKGKRKIFKTVITKDMIYFLIKMCMSNLLSINDVNINHFFPDMETFVNNISRYICVEEDCIYLTIGDEKTYKDKFSLCIFKDEKDRISLVYRCRDRFKHMLYHVQYQT
jgi:hypothetical protein